MKQNAFDILIRSAAPAVPDPGPSRRQLRVVLRGQMLQAQRRSARQHARGVSLAAVLTFCVVFGGQVEPLGSDGFDITSETYQIASGETIVRDESPFAGPSGSSVAGVPREQIAELYQSMAADEGVPSKLSGWRVDGNTYWMMEYQHLIEGYPIIRGGEPRDLIGQATEVGPQLMKFVATESDGFLELVKNNRIAAVPAEPIRSNGLVFAMRAWTRAYPGFGNVTYFEGVPAAP